jgi:hypothetical protein
MRNSIIRGLTLFGQPSLVRPPKMRNTNNRGLLLWVSPLLWLLLLALLPCGCMSTSATDQGEPIDRMTGSANSYFTEPAARALVRAVETQDLAAIDRALANGTVIDSVGREGVTPLWWAIRFYRKDSFRHLLERGANPNVAIKDHWGILHLAAGYRDPEYLRLALAHKAEPNRVNGVDNDLPLHLAISYQRKENLLQLIVGGADLDARPRGESFLCEAVAIGSYEFVYLMLKAGADGTKDDDSQSLRRYIAVRVINPDSEAYVWRERVIALLREKGITATKPEREPPRTLPLPPL